MRPDFETGIMLGQALAQIREHDSRLTDHSDRIGKVEADIRSAKNWIGRAITAGGLWSVGLAINLPAEQIGKVIATLLRHAP